MQVEGACTRAPHPQTGLVLHEGPGQRVNALISWRLNGQATQPQVYAVTTCPEGTQRARVCVGPEA
eukprot:2704493-Alexandrium_andersonii.AAC.1